MVPPRRNQTKYESEDQIEIESTQEESNSFVDVYANYVVETCNNIITQSQGSDIILMGDCLGKCYHFLNGVFEQNRACLQTKIQAFQFTHGRAFATFEEITNEDLRHMRRYMKDMELSPKTLLKRRTPVVLVDVIGSGGTLNSLILLLYKWCLDDKIDWNSVRKRFSVIALESDSYYRCFYECRDWIDLIGGLHSMKRMMIDDNHLNFGDKNSDYNCDNANNINDFEYENAERMSGVEICKYMYKFGLSVKGKKSLANLMCNNAPLMKIPWYRSYIHALKERQVCKIHAEGAQTKKNKGISELSHNKFTKVCIEKNTRKGAYKDDCFFIYDVMRDIDGEEKSNR